MRIAVVGAGAIGGNLARKLSAAGHDVQVADARGATRIPAEVLDSGARAVEVDAAVLDRDVIILAIPYDRVPEVSEALAGVPDQTVVIDTSNYYPHLNGVMEGVDEAQAETLRNAELLGRPLVKAWNSALAGTQQTKGLPAGAPGRIAIPVAGDSDHARRVAMDLVNDTGFDPYDAGALADSWRQQPMGPAYCTELTVDELAAALAASSREQNIAVRDSMFERFAALGEAFTHADVIETNRAAHR